MKKIFSLFAALLFVGTVWGDPAAVGTTLFSENFGAYSADDVPSGSVSTSTGNRVVYGGGSVTYACTNGNGTKPGTTKIWAEALATGKSPELLIGKYGTSGTTGGTFSITGIPSGGAQTITVSFKQNKQKLKVAVSGTGYTSDGVDAKPSDAGTVSFDITVANNAAATFDLTFSVYSSNVRLDDIEVTVKTAGEAPKYAVSIDPAIEGGSVNITGATDLTKVEAGTELTVSATPDAENHYIGGVVTVAKTSDASDVTSTVYNSSTGKLTMPAYAITVSATFTPTYKINLVADGGSIALDYTADGAAEGYAIEGTVINAEATADGTHTFKSLEVSDNAIDVTVVDNLAEFTMPAAAVTVTATFDEVKTSALSVDETELAFGSVDINSTPVPQTFHVSGVNLSEGTLNIVSNNEAFTVLPASINVNGTLAATEVTVTPVTTTAGTFNGKITISGVNDLSKEVALSLTVNKLAAGISWAEESKVGVLGEAYTHPTLNNPNSLMVSLSSTDESVAYFDEGQIVLNAAGTTTIKATSVETSVYAQGVASYTLTVKEKYTITWHVNGATQTTEEVEGDIITPIADPELSEDYEEKVFKGWLTTELATTDEAPAFVDFSALAASANADYYAVFATKSTKESEKEANYTHTLTAKKWEADGDQTLSDVSWTLATDGTYFGYDATKGQQIGSGKAPASELTLSTSGLSGTIKQVKIYTSGANEIEATVSVSVNSVDYLSGEDASKAISSTNTAYTFTGSQKGEIVISWAQTSSKAIYFKQIEVVYGVPEIVDNYTGYTTSVKKYVAVTFNATPDHGTLAVKNAGTPIASGDKVLQGTTLIVEAEPTSEIYELATLTANGADIKDDKQFTVVDAAVEVVATFALKSFASLEALAAAGLADGTDVVVSFSNVEITQLDGILGAVYTTVKDNEDRTVGIVASEYLDPSWIVGGFVSGTAIEGTWKVGAKSTLNTKNGWTGISYTKPEAPISWSATEATAYTIGKENNLPTLSNAKGLTIAYSSTNTAAATINAETGAVTLVAAGTTIIKATYTEDVYQGKVVEYTLNVYVPDYITIGGELTNDEYDNGDVFDFTGLTATLTYTDGEILDVTAVATWNINETANKVVYPRNTPTVLASYAGKTGIEYNVPITFKKYAVTFNTPEHGTLTVSNGVNVLKSGDAVVKGTGLVVYATPASSDYVLSSLKANGADIEQGGDAYTVGTEAVNIVATFTEKPDAPIAWMHADTVAKNLTIYLDKEYTLPTLSNEQSLVVELTSSNESVAVFDGTELKVAGVGESTISAEFFGNGDYKAKKVSYDLKVVEKTPTAINNIDSNEAVVKTMENGVLIIRRGNKTFNAQGQLLK